MGYTANNGVAINLMTGEGGGGGRGPYGGNNAGGNAMNHPVSGARRMHTAIGSDRLYPITFFFFYFAAQYALRESVGCGGGPFCGVRRSRHQILCLLITQN